MDNGRKRNRVLRVNQFPWANAPLSAPLNSPLYAVGLRPGLTGKSTRRG